MKGKLYAPKSLSPDSSFMKKSSSHICPRNYSVTSLEYVWRSSIPDSWLKIMKERNITHIELHKNNRSTLDFLQETQQYIRNICKPANLDRRKSELNPLEEQKISAKTSRVPSLNQSPQPEIQAKDIKKNFMRKRRRLFELHLKEKDAKNANLILPKIRNVTKSCSAITLQLC